MSCWSSDGVLRTLWEKFEAIPVVPINPRLSVFSVLRKGRKTKGFHIIGDVASVCGTDVDPEKMQELKEEQISSGSGELHEIGTMLFATSYDFSVGLKFLASDLLNLGGAGLEARIKSIRNKGLLAEDVRHRSLPPTKLKKLLDDKWRPDLKDTDLIWKNGKTEIWVVDLVIEVKSLRVFDREQFTAEMGVAIPIPAAGVKFTLGPGFDLEGVGVTIIGGTGAHQPVAFRGRKYVFNQGGKMVTSTLDPDGPDSETSAMVKDPTTSEMEPFVEENWFATILD